MEDHYLPNGALVVGYRGQLANNGHQFGQHKLTQNCKCSPWVDSSGDVITVRHNERHL